MSTTHIPELLPLPPLPDDTPHPTPYSLTPTSTNKNNLKDNISDTTSNTGDIRNEADVNSQYRVVNLNNDRKENEKKLLLNQLQRRKIVKQVSHVPRRTTNKFKQLREGSQRGFSMDRKPATPVYDTS